MWNASSSIVNAGPLKVLIIKVCQCNVLVFSGFISSQHAMGVILVSKEARFGIDSNDSSPMCIACKTIKLFKFFLVRSQRKQSIIISRAHINVLIAYCTCNTVASHYAFFLRTYSWLKILFYIITQEHSQVGMVPFITWTYSFLLSYCALLFALILEFIRPNL